MSREGLSNALPQNEQGNMVRVRFFNTGSPDSLPRDVGQLDATDATAVAEGVVIEEIEEFETDVPVDPLDAVSCDP